MLLCDCRNSLRSIDGRARFKFRLTIATTAVLVGILFGVRVRNIQDHPKVVQSAESDEVGPLLSNTLADDLATAFVLPVSDAPTSSAK